MRELCIEGAGNSCCCSNFITLLSPETIVSLDGVFSSGRSMAKLECNAIVFVLVPIKYHEDKDRVCVLCDATKL